MCVHQDSNVIMDIATGNPCSTVYSSVFASEITLGYSVKNDVPYIVKMEDPAWFLKMDIKYAIVHSLTRDIFVRYQRI